MLADYGVTAPHHILSGTAQEIPLEDGCVDLAFTAGVLIHIAPDDLLAACKEIHRCARKHIICMEYFADEPEANAADPVLCSVPAARRETLLAQPADDEYRFDIRLQGPGETVFFAL